MVRLTINKRILLGFATILILLVGLSTVAFLSLRNASQGFTAYREMARDANLSGHLTTSIQSMQMDVAEFLRSNEQADADRFEQNLANTLDLLETAQVEIQKPERAARIDAVQSLVADYEDEFEAAVAMVARRHEIVRGVLDVNGPLLEEGLGDIMISAREDEDLVAAYYSGLAMRYLMLGRLDMAKYLDTNEPDLARHALAEFAKMEDNLATLDRELQNPERRKILASIQKRKTIYTDNFTALVTAITKRNEHIRRALDEIGPAMVSDVAAVREDIIKVQDTLGPRLVATNNKARAAIAGASVIALFAGVVLTILISRSISRPLTRLTAEMAAAANQVNAASDDVAASSQTLANGSNEQASSLEEISSSLEEMTSMTKQNAQNAGHADQLSQQTTAVVNQASGVMEELTSSMDDITEAGKRTQKIVQTIDEIAFQTNLLALNAAVEAARAGEAGAGFTIVADEVRVLAMRAAEAARNTAELIEQTVSRVAAGSNHVAKTTEEFGRVATNTTEMTSLVGEITAATQDQSLGISQVNDAVAQLDQAVQSNAASAQQSASASAEMRTQYESIMSCVEALQTMVGQTEMAAPSRHHQPPPGGGWRIDRASQGAPRFDQVGV